MTQTQYVVAVAPRQAPCLPGCRASGLSLPVLACRGSRLPPLTAGPSKSSGNMYGFIVQCGRGHSYPAPAEPAPSGRPGLPFSCLGAPACLHSPRAPLRLRAVSELTARPCAWLWAHRLALGEASLFEADPG